MHEYGTDSSHATRAIIGITILSILSAWLLNKGLQWLDWTVPWWVDAPSVLGFFGIYWKLYDKYAWKWHIGKFRVSDVPDMSGKWSGVVVSSHDHAEIPISASIVQTASRVLVQTETEMSNSSSVMATINCKPGLFQGLNYVYQNWPKTLAPEMLTPHRGRAQLKFLGDNELAGEYSTDIPRGNEGTIRLTRNNS